MANNKIEDFYEDYKEKIKEPIIQKFLEDEYNYKLLTEIINNPSEQKKNELDLRFKNHYRRVKIIHYMSKLIHFYSMDFDKRYNRNRSREVLKIDNSSEPTSNSSSFSFDKLTSSQSDLTVDDYERKNKKLGDLIEDEILFEALNVLSEKQIEVLELIYVKNYTNKEIALILNESNQTISYNHKAALKKLESVMKDKKKLG